MDECANHNGTIEQRILGKTGIKVSVLCYACASAWARNLITDQQAMKLFEQAYASGINFFDTGYSYGKAEERIGQILKSSGRVKREKIVISTKFGTRVINRRYIHDVSPDWIKQSVETSLNRMGTDYIDILYIHTARLSDFTDSLFYTLDDLKKQGIIKATGASVFDSPVIQYICDHKCLDIVMLDYNIVRQDREPEIDALYDKGIGVVAGQALAESAFLNDILKIKSKKDLWYLARTIGRKPSRKLYFEGRKYRFLNHIDGYQGSQIALKYVIDNPHIASASVGTCIASHLQSNIESLNITIPSIVLQQIRNVEMKQG